MKILLKENVSQRNRPFKKNVECVVEVSFAVFKLMRKVRGLILKYVIVILVRKTIQIRFNNDAIVTKMVWFYKYSGNDNNKSQIYR